MSEQITREELDRMSPDEILAAEEDGRLRALLSGLDPATTPARDGGAANLTREDVAEVSPDEIIAAHDAGRLDVVLGIRPADDGADEDPDA